MFRCPSPKNNLQRAIDIHQSLQNPEVASDDSRSIQLFRQLNAIVNQLSEADKKVYDETVSPKQPEFVRPHGCMI